METSTPLGSEFAASDNGNQDVAHRPLMRSPAYNLRHATQVRDESRAFWRRRVQVICAMALVFADCCGFVAAAGSASLLIQTAGRWITLSPDPLSDVMTHAEMSDEIVVLLGVLIACARNGHYWRRMPFWSALRDLSFTSLAAMLCTGFLQYAFQHHDSRLFLVLTWLLFAPAAVLARGLARNLLSRLRLWQFSVVVVGSGEAAEQATSALHSEPALGYQVVKVISSFDPSVRQYRQDSGHWRHVLQRHGADMLVLALNANDHDARMLTESLVRARVPFATMPQLEGLPVLGFEQTSFFSHDTIMFSYRNNLAKPGARATKIVFDLLAAAFLLLLALPVLVVIGVAVRLDGGPMLFAHRRIGANGREFPCFKFRSMVVDAEGVLRRTLASDPEAAAEWADGCKLRRDPRVTRIGRLLRATSLDELPQLLNVLRLEMSLVGPRPIVRSEVPRYAENITYYYEARPGVTGLWQVSGRSDTSYAQRVQLDTWYVKNWTIWHDVAILAKTIPAVLKRQGAV